MRSSGSIERARAPQQTIAAQQSAIAAQQSAIAALESQRASDVAALQAQQKETMELRERLNAIEQKLLH